MERSAALRVCHAGALKAVLGDEIVPALKDASGCEIELHGGQSVRLANELRRGTLVANLFLSANAQVNTLLAGPENGDLVDSTVLLAATDLVIVYSPRSRFSDVPHMAARGALPWYEALLAAVLRYTQNPGLADVFVRELLSETGRAALARHGFSPIPSAVTA
ncbi:MAG: substrate-binding domain-containing protein [Dehalococcoidia bacterium]